jgi:CDP-diacylglycerol--glycerol-3-phosphate 3-phosphatidyltransferase
MRFGSAIRNFQALPLGLRRQIISLGAWILAALLVAQVVDLGKNGMAFSAASMATHIYFWIEIAIRGGHYRKSAEHPLLQQLAPALYLTFLRALGVGWLAGWLASPPDASSWMPGMVYLGVAALDWLDGYVARRSASETVLGAWLDLRVDAFGLLVAPCLAWRLDRLPWWYLLFAVAYYVYRAAIWLRRLTGAFVDENRVQPSLHTRAFAGAQMGLVAFALLPIFDRLAFAWTAALFVAFSLAAFVRDWGLLCGWIDANSPVYRSVRASTLSLFAQKIPVLSRLFLTCVMVHFAAGNAIDFTSTSAILGTLAVALIVIGVLARFLALLLSVALLTLPHVDPLEIVSLMALLWIFLWGAGPSLYAPEDQLFLRRFGGSEKSA